VRSAIHQCTCLPAGILLKASSRADSASAWPAWIEICVGNESPVTTTHHTRASASPDCQSEAQGDVTAGDQVDPADNLVHPHGQPSAEQLPDDRRLGHPDSGDQLRHWRAGDPACREHMLVSPGPQVPAVHLGHRQDWVAPVIIGICGR